MITVSTAHGHRREALRNVPAAPLAAPESLVMASFATADSACSGQWEGPIFYCQVFLLNAVTVIANCCLRKGLEKVHP